MLTPLKALPIAPVLEDLGLRSDRLRTVGDPASAAQAGPRHAAATVPPSAAPEAAARALLHLAAAEASPDGALLALCQGERTDADIASLRNALWPAWHVVALYRIGNGGIARITLRGAEKLRGGSGLAGNLVVARTRATVLAPDATVAKFDQNAAGWNGDPGSPGYAHFRWMRRFVAEFAPAGGARRILDFGCGAGWVGIEAALRNPGASLAAFDPSPEMVKLAEANAREAGVASFEGRTGFGEEPPFPAAGEQPFDLVYSSGVISFSGDRERWLDGLVSTLGSRATLVIGDIERGSLGMQRRRRAKPLLPVREMNACTREEVREALERRGLAFEAWTGYQRTWPVPEAMHWDATRARGLFSAPLLAWNRLASSLETKSGAKHPERFDSFVMRLSRG